MDYQFLKDEPVDKNHESYFDFAHEAISVTLAQIINNESSPQTIGLFGSWGTGKSTVIRMLGQEKELAGKVFTLDVWKYQGDALRRAFLLQLADFLHKEGKYGVFPYLKLHNMFYSTTSYEQTLDIPVPKTVKAWHVFKSLFSNLAVSAALTFALALVYTVIQVAFEVEAVANALLFLVITALLWVIRLVFGEMMRQRIIQKYQSPSIAISQSTRSDPFSSPEQFDSTFGRILTSFEGNLVIVFDNIDRVEGETAISILSTIRNFMDADQNEAEVTFVVPCDLSALETQVDQYFNRMYGATNHIAANEYLKKIFGLNLWVPDIIGDDLDEYTRRLIRFTGAKASKLLDNEEVLLVINSAFCKNPREIIQFLNNLVANIMSVQNSSIKDVVNQDIAYLAKILVMRHKFPAKYLELKERWFDPDAIIPQTSEDIEEHRTFYDFMQRTRGIVAKDTELFLCLKNPIQYYGLPNAYSLRMGFITEDYDGVIRELRNIIRQQGSDKVLLFIAGLLARYAKMKVVAARILKTQFKVIRKLKIQTNAKLDETKALVMQSLVDEDYQSLIHNPLQGAGRWDQQVIESIIDLIFNPRLAKRQSDQLFQQLMRNLKQSGILNDPRGYSSIELQPFQAILKHPMYLKDKTVSQSKIQCIRDNFSHPTLLKLLPSTT